MLNGQEVEHASWEVRASLWAECAQKSGSHWETRLRGRERTCSKRLRNLDYLFIFFTKKQSKWDWEIITSKYPQPTGRFDIITSFPFPRFSIYFLLGQSPPRTGLTHLLNMPPPVYRLAHQQVGRGHTELQLPIAPGWGLWEEGSHHHCPPPGLPSKWFSLSLIKDDLMSTQLHLSLCWPAIVFTERDKD